MAIGPEPIVQRLMHEMRERARLVPRSPIDALMDDVRNVPHRPPERMPDSIASGLPPAPGTSGHVKLDSIANLGPLVRQARKAMKMSQSEFGAHAGVGRRFVSELEGGKPSLEFDKALSCAAAAGIEVFARTRSS